MLPVWVTSSWFWKIAAAPGRLHFASVTTITEVGLSLLTSIMRVAAGIWVDSGISWDPDTWYNIGMNVDFNTQTYDFSVDGSPVASGIAFYNGDSVSSFGAIRIYRGGSQTGMILDDLSVQAVPEPTAVAILLLGGAGLLLRRKLRA